jgi:hypothetical protein
MNRKKVDGSFKIESLMDRLSFRERSLLRPVFTDNYFFRKKKGEKIVRKKKKRIFAPPKSGK